MQVAAIYAQALLELADERGKRAAVVDNCRELAQFLADSRDTVVRLSDPRLGKVHLKALLQATFAGRLEAETLDFLKLLVDRNRFDLARDIVAAVIDRAEAQAGVVHVAVTSARELSQAGQARLMAELKAHVGPGVVMHLATDPTLIGGVTMRIADLLVDGSVRRHLDEMKSLILNAPLDDRVWEGQPEGVGA
jgi:F-type H+-transporting ATPase subunit delta